MADHGLEVMPLTAVLDGNEEVLLVTGSSECWQNWGGGGDWSSFLYTFFLQIS